MIFFARLHGLGAREAKCRAGELLEAVGLADSARVPVGCYSHGMQKRLSVARALLVHPALLLVDEATHDLDPAGAGSSPDAGRAARRARDRGAVDDSAGRGDPRLRPQRQLPVQGNCLLQRNGGGAHRPRSFSALRGQYPHGIRYGLLTRSGCSARWEQRHRSPLEQTALDTSCSSPRRTSNAFGSAIARLAEAGFLVTPAVRSRPRSKAPSWRSRQRSDRERAHRIREGVGFVRRDLRIMLSYRMAAVGELTGVAGSSHRVLVRRAAHRPLALAELRRHTRRLP